jgi:ATP-dependent DNA helicase RecG
MTNLDLVPKLHELMGLPAETEWVEFKEAKTSFNFEKLGEYFSALSNEANLKGREHGWLVFGVTDKMPRHIVGTKFKPDRPSLDALKKQVADQTNNRLTFEDIHELSHPLGRVLFFEIPAALRGAPTSWRGHYYGRDGESIGPLNPHEYEQIRRQAIQGDWSAQLVEGATFGDLNPQAVQFARVQYQIKYPDHTAELSGWDDATFLNKAKVCIGGKLTRTALLLVGNEESAHFLSPAQARITWVLRDENNIEKDYQHFTAPFILASDQLLGKIRNLTIRQLPSGTLFPHEITQYDPWVIRETLHNCIAHQDYMARGRINVVETPESMLFTNLGSFIPGTVEEMIRSDAPPEVYRNPFLAQAMVNLNMIDTIGSGIKRMFILQRQRSLPMPDYDLSDPKKVVVRLTGRVLDENYTQLLMSQAEIDLMDVIALDKVQKKRPLDNETFKRLKTRKFIEGRRPNIFVSAKIADVTGDRAAYIRNRAFDKAHYKEMIIAYLQKFGEGARSDMDGLLLEKLSDALDGKQKKRYITNLLQEMKKEGHIFPDGTTRWAKWRMSKLRAKGDVQA